VNESDASGRAGNKTLSRFDEAVWDHPKPLLYKTDSIYI
jgi:hypothetical protein